MFSMVLWFRFSFLSISTFVLSFSCIGNVFCSNRTEYATFFAHANFYSYFNLSQLSCQDFSFIVRYYFMVSNGVLFFVFALFTLVVVPSRPRPFLINTLRPYASLTSTISPFLPTFLTSSNNTTFIVVPPLVQRNEGLLEHALKWPASLPLRSCLVIGHQPQFCDHRHPRLPLQLVHLPYLWIAH